MINYHTKNYIEEGVDITKHMLIISIKHRNTSRRVYSPGQRITDRYRHSKSENKDPGGLENTAFWREIESYKDSLDVKLLENFTKRGPSGGAPLIKAFYYFPICR